MTGVIGMPEPTENISHAAWLNALLKGLFARSDALAALVRTPADGEHGISVRVSSAAWRAANTAARSPLPRAPAMPSDDAGSTR